MADQSSEANAAPSEETSRTRPENLTPASSDTTLKEEQAKKASSGLMDPQVRAVHAPHGTRDYNSNCGAWYTISI